MSKRKKIVKTFHGERIALYAQLFTGGKFIQKEKKQQVAYYLSKFIL